MGGGGANARVHFPIAFRTRAQGHPQSVSTKCIFQKAEQEEKKMLTWKWKALCAELSVLVLGQWHVFCNLECSSGTARRKVHRHSLSPSQIRQPGERQSNAVTAAHLQLSGVSEPAAAAFSQRLVLRLDDGHHRPHPLRLRSEESDDALHLRDDCVAGMARNQLRESAQSERSRAGKNNWISFTSQWNRKHLNNQSFLIRAWMLKKMVSRLMGLLHD